MQQGTAAAAEQEDELERLLREVADEDRTVIMTSVNEAWAAQDSLLDLFLESFRSGERIAHFVDHLLVVALDGGALEHCRAVHPHCYLLPAAAARNLSGEKVFMSKDYIDLVWSKVRLQQRILELGYNFLFTVRTHARSSLTWNSSIQEQQTRESETELLVGMFYKTTLLILPFVTMHAGRGHSVVPEPVRADVGGGAHGDLVGLLLR